eukprot:8353614-Pyramimonas_sp.AAC.1
MFPIDVPRSGKILSIKLGPGPPDYKSNCSRSIFPHDIFRYRALARDFLTMFAGKALSRGTS